MEGNSIQKIVLGEVYSEESVKRPALITLAVLVLLTIPLGLWILSINKEGAQSNDVGRYVALMEEVSIDVKTVAALSMNDTDTLAAIDAFRNNQSVTLIVPEIVIVEEEKTPNVISPLNIELSGIYWSPNNPLAGINGETYGVGEQIQGYEITRIEKTTVHFKANDGSIVVKDMDEILLEK